VCPILEYRVACWDPYREGLMNALDQVQNKTAKFSHHRNDLNWETLAQHRKIVRMCALLKAYTGEWAWKDICDRLRRTDIGKNSFVNRTIQLWNRLPANALGTLSCKPSNFRKFSEVK
jgi:hypothetical protein